MIANGQARGVLPRGHELLVTRARSAALRQADLVIVAGHAARLPARVRLVRPEGRAGPGGARGRLARPGSRRTSRWPRRRPVTWRRSSPRWPRRPAAGTRRAADPDWVPGLAEAVRAALAADGPLLASEADPMHPARIYGELLQVLDDDAVVIGDGGDFVSFAGKYVEPARPGGWLDPGPFGCLGTGLGYAIAARIARPSAQVVLLLGDGAAGFSLMDADTLVRHGLPVVMVCGNNAGWGLERHPMRCPLRLRRRRRPAAGLPLRRGGARARRRRRDRHRAGGDRPRAAPRLRVRRAVPGQRGHRPGDRLPALDHRGVERRWPSAGPVSRWWRSGRLPGRRRPRRRAAW